MKLGFFFVETLNPPVEASLTSALLTTVSTVSNLATSRLESWQDKL